MKPSANCRGAGTRIVVEGAASGGRIVVRSIAEIFNYPACANSQVPQNGKYDWDFHVKHIFPAVTTLNGGNIPEEHRRTLRRMGLKWLANVGTTSPKDAADLVERMSQSPGHDRALVRRVHRRRAVLRPPRPGTLHRGPAARSRTPRTG